MNRETRCELIGAISPIICGMLFILGYWVGCGIFGEDIKMTEPHLWAVKSGGNFLEGLRFRPSFCMYRVRGRGSLDQAEDSRIWDQGLGSWFVGLGKVVAVREGDGRI